MGDDAPRLVRLCRRSGPDKTSLRFTTITHYRFVLVYYDMIPRDDGLLHEWFCLLYRCSGHQHFMQSWPLSKTEATSPVEWIKSCWLSPRTYDSATCSELAGEEEDSIDGGEWCFDGGLRLESAYAA